MAKKKKSSNLENLVFLGVDLGTLLIAIIAFFCPVVSIKVFNSSTNFGIFDGDDFISINPAFIWIYVIIIVLIICSLVFSKLKGDNLFVSLGVLVVSLVCTILLHTVDSVVFLGSTVGSESKAIGPILMTVVGVVVILRHIASIVLNNKK